MSDYLFDPKSGAPADDPEVAELEHLLGAYAHRDPLRALPAARRPRRAMVAIAVGAAMAAVVAVVLLLVPDRPAPRPVPPVASCAPGGAGFSFAVTAGAARCGGGATEAGTLPVGAWLETGDGAVADVRVADIGALTVFGDSRLRLVGTGPGEHRLELARGRLSARVLAAPRLFVIDTPVATAVDLGCAYDLEVDAAGTTHLRVTSGAVSLEGRVAKAYVPMGTEVVSVPGHGPGTPVGLDAPAALRAAVTRFDEGDTGALAAIVDTAGRRDTITLWNLLTRTDGADRAVVVRALERLAGVPEWVRTEDILAGDVDAIETWRQTLDEDWMLRCRVHASGAKSDRRSDPGCLEK